MDIQTSDLRCYSAPTECKGHREIETIMGSLFFVRCTCGNSNGPLASSEGEAKQAYYDTLSKTLVDSIFSRKRSA